MKFLILLLSLSSCYDKIIEDEFKPEIYEFNETRHCTYQGYCYGIGGFGFHSFCHGERLTKIRCKFGTRIYKSGKIESIRQCVDVQYLSECD